MNNVNLIGRLTKDPELRKTSEGRSVCTFTLAVDDVYAKDDRADFIKVTVFGNQGDNCEKYLQKGAMAGVCGRIRCDSYVDNEGVKRYPVGVIAERVKFLTWPSEVKTAEVKASVAV